MRSSVQQDDQLSWRRNSGVRCQKGLGKKKKKKEKEHFFAEKVLFCLSQIKVGTWAKTSLREDATFVLRCVFKASDGRTCAALSSNFQIFSHQSQLPQKKGKSEKSSGRKRTRPIGAPKQETTPPAPVAPMVHLQNGLSPTFAAVKQEEDVFGLHSLSDAALKAASSEEAVAPVSDERLKKKILLERADDLALRIRTLQDEERLLREQAANVASH